MQSAQREVLFQQIMDAVTPSVRSVMYEDHDIEDVLHAIEDALDLALVQFSQSVSAGERPLYEYDEVVRLLKLVRDGQHHMLPRDLWEEVRYGHPV